MTVAMLVNADRVSGTAVEVKTTLPELFRTVKEASACSVAVTALSTSAETVTVCPASANGRAWGHVDDRHHVLQWRRDRR